MSATVRAVRSIAASVTTRPHLWVLAHVIIATPLMMALPADAWFVSDPGAKLVATQNVLRHPSRPFEADLPAIPVELARSLRQPYFEVHGDHAHAVTSQVFPLMSAPFVAAWGARGLMALPLVAWVLIGPLTARLARIVSLGVPAWAVIGASAFATPFVFYGLEAWEHAPAVAAGLGAAVLIIPARGRMDQRVAGGVLAALSALLRPEMAATALAVAFVAWRRQRSTRGLAAFATGIAVGLSPFVLYNLTHFGTVASPHLTTNFAVVSEGWWRDRADYLKNWFWPTRTTTLIAMSLFLISAALTRWTRWRSAGIAMCLIVLSGLALEAALGHEVPENFFRVFPVGLVALLPVASRTPARRDLWVLIWVPLVGCWLTAPNDGGGQWGVRYLLALVPPMLCLAWDAVAGLGFGRRTRVAVAVWFVLAGLAASRSAWRDLGGSKEHYSHLVGQTAAAAAGTTLVLTDVWWVGAAHAAGLEARRIVYVESAVQMGAVIAAIAPAEVLVVEGTERAGAAAGGVGGRAGGGAERFRAWGCTAHEPLDSPPIDERIRFVRLSCRAG